jgi:hypothetical protein
MQLDTAGLDDSLAGRMADHTHYSPVVAHTDRHTLHTAAVGAAAVAEVAFAVAGAPATSGLAADRIHIGAGVAVVAAEDIGVAVGDSYASPWLRCRKTGERTQTMLCCVCDVRRTVSLAQAPTAMQTE